MNLFHGTYRVISSLFLAIKEILTGHFAIIALEYDFLMPLARPRTTEVSEKRNFRILQV